MCAPHGVLWLARWEQVGFVRRNVKGLAPHAGVPIERAQCLRDLLCRTGVEADARVVETGAPAARVGLWCVPTLLGECSVPPEQLGLRLHLGDSREGLTVAANCAPAVPRRVAFAVIDAKAGGLHPTWPEFARTLEITNFGYQFWIHGADRGDRRSPRYVSVCLMPTSDDYRIARLTDH